MIFKFFHSWWRSQNYLKRPFTTKILKSVLIFTILLFIIFIYTYQDAFSTGRIILFLGENPFLAPTLFILIYAVMVLFFLPTLPMNLLGGLIWGTYLGGALTVVGASLGSTCAFLMARYFAYEFISRNLDK
jgi:uncharacterized membrane protein YdjX (TVP38/TMEM64 family)